MFTDLLIHVLMQRVLEINALFQLKITSTLLSTIICHIIKSLTFRYFEQVIMYFMVNTVLIGLNLFKLWLIFRSISSVQPPGHHQLDFLVLVP